MGIKFFNKGFNFNQDGPGNRLVYHLSGCNMRCRWCANPEGFLPTAGKEITVEEIVDESIRCKPMFFCGGGVTFTGGEATLYHDELKKVLKSLKDAGIHTAIETNGTDERLYELLEILDYLIMDFKHYDDEMLKRYTGIDTKTVKANFERNCASGWFQHIRIPLVNGVNTEHPEKFVEYFSRFDTANTVFEFLTYHEYGKNKWTEEYEIKDGFVKKSCVDAFVKTFTNKNLKIVNT